MIRSFSLADLNSLLEIEAQSFPKTPYPWTTFIQLYWIHPETFWVYADGDKDGGPLRGYIIFSKDGHLISLAVDPRYRRKGIGKALTEKAMEALSAKEMWAEVRRSNRGALAFYRRLGFKIVGMNRNYYGNEDALIVRWRPAEGYSKR